MSYLIRRVLAKPRLILDERCRLYGMFASYFSSYKWPYCVCLEVFSIFPPFVLVKKSLQLLSFPIAGERNCVTTVEIISKSEREKWNWFHNRVNLLGTLSGQPRAQTYGKTCRNFSGITFLESMCKRQKDIHQANSKEGRGT